MVTPWKSTRDLRQSQSERYLPDFARSLGTLGRVLLSLGEHRRAQEAFSEAIELVRPFADRFPGSRFEKLLKTLTSDLERARKAGR
jgi:tetratricopeptide (TPR) repeat protein